MHPRIFISYRRKDSGGYAGRLQSGLAAHFGAENVFMDIGIEAGEDFVSRLEQELVQCSIVIVMIGERWLGERNGRRRIDESGDYVRMELARALQRSILVVPILVDGAHMPKGEALPEDIRQVSRRNALEMRNADWDRSMALLVGRIESELGIKKRSVRRSPVAPVLPWLVAAAAALIAGVALWRGPSVSQPAAIPAPTPTTVPTPRPSLEVTPAPPPTATRVMVAAPTPSLTPAPTAPPRQAAIVEATKEKPYAVPGLGMTFVPVPFHGDTVLFCQHETRVSDFAAFVKRSGYDMRKGEKMMPWLNKDDWTGPDWRNPGFAQTDEHPVVGVSWEDAVAFCEWLTKRERQAGRLTERQEYRLPTDAEWSAAVGILDERGRSPEEKRSDHRYADIYPWGSDFPPPRGAGNFAGEETNIGREKNPREVINGWRDNDTHTAKVMSYAPNKFGIYDLAGNAEEWCESSYDLEGLARVSRGGSWATSFDKALLSSSRKGRDPRSRDERTGFRVVLVDDL